MQVICCLRYVYLATPPRTMELNGSQKASLEVYNQKQNDLKKENVLPEYTTSFNKKHPFTDYYRPIKTVYDGDIAYKQMYRSTMKYFK